MSIIVGGNLSIVTKGAGLEVKAGLPHTPELLLIGSRSV